MHKPTCLINNHVFFLGNILTETITSWPDLVPGQLMTILNWSTNQGWAPPVLYQSEARIPPRCPLIELYLRRHPGSVTWPVATSNAACLKYCCQGNCFKPHKLFCCQHKLKQTIVRVMGCVRWPPSCVLTMIYFKSKSEWVMSLVVVLGKTMAYCLQINARDVKLKLLCCHLMPSDIIKLPRMSVSGQEAR